MKLKCFTVKYEGDGELQQRHGHIRETCQIKKNEISALAYFEKLRGIVEYGLPPIFAP